MPSWARRAQVGFDWAWLLVFPRDLSCIRTDLTDRISHAHFEPGDAIIRQGEPPTSFYVIEAGEVEIVRASPEHPDGEVIAKLGPGSFFGEQSLLNDRPRSASVRARTAVEVVVMGRHVFTTISTTLAPLRDAFMATIARRTPNSWQERPAVRAALREFQLVDFIEPAPQPLLRPDATLLEVTRRFALQNDEMFLVSADGERLDGLITLTDVLRAHATGTAPDAPLAKFMVAEPKTIAATDTCLVAAAAFREYGHKLLPVVADPASRRIVGLVRARKLISKIMQVVGPPPASTVPPVGPA
jgi:NADH dehydrogenase